MIDKRFETLKEKYSLPKKLEKKVKKEICINCYNDGAYQTYPKSECAVCGGVGYIRKNEK